MNISGLVSIQILWFFTTLVLLGNTKGMQIESAKIIYDISGGGVLTSDSNLTFDGIEKYYMKGHGETALSHLKLIEKVEGSIDSLEQIEKIEKYTDVTAYHVDFDKEIIVTFKNRGQTYCLSDMNQTGEEVIANHHCKVWKNSYEKVCMFGEIPLLLEKSYLGFLYRKRARIALFDLNISDELFLLPDFPIEKNTLVENSIKTTDLRTKHFFYKKILDAKEYNSSIVLRNDFSHELVEKQKRELPLALEDIKKARECFSVASSQEDANSCIDNLHETITLLSASKTFNLDIWTKEIQERVLAYLEENIFKLQSSMPCLKRAQNIDDLATCMKK